MNSIDPATPDLTRYARQMRFEPIGEDGQRRLLTSRVALVGCGALGTVLANTLTRAGVGFLRVIDRDFVELDNLQRQVLFDEDDLRDNLPKAQAAARKLRRINSQVVIEPLVVDVNAGNIEHLCSDVDLILDGTDNFEARFLINDAAIKLGKPWVYGACIAAEGRVMAVLPGQTPCLRCIWEDAPPPGSAPTCETAGVLASVVNVVASLQAVEAIKILTGRLDDVCRRLTTIDVWRGVQRAVTLDASATNPNCPCCQRREFQFLHGGRTSMTTSLCGRDAVQVTPAESGDMDFERLAESLGPDASVVFNEFLMKFSAGGRQVTLFRDGRAIIKGAGDESAARAVYAKYVGN